MPIDEDYDEDTPNAGRKFRRPDEGTIGLIVLGFVCLMIVVALALSIYATFFKDDKTDTGPSQAQIVQIVRDNSLSQEQVITIVNDAIAGSDTLVSRHQLCVSVLTSAIAITGSTGIDIDATCADQPGFP